MARNYNLELIGADMVNFIVTDENATETNVNTKTMHKDDALETIKKHKLDWEKAYEDVKTKIDALHNHLENIADNVDSLSNFIEGLGK